jgi:diphthine methyl ester synthase
MLYIIGLGLGNEKDITVRGLEAVKNCDKIYLESYTSILQCSKEDLETFYLKKIILADRNMSEQGFETILNEAKVKDVAFLVVGDPFSATTHSTIYKEAIDEKVVVEVINNASILTAVGRVGLELYKYGKTTSIPFVDNVANLETPYNVLKENQSIGLHTLFLLDLKPPSEFMTIKEALEILLKIESVKLQEVISADTLVVGCARLGSDNMIKSGKLKEVKEYDFGKAPFCLIIPAKMHFVEEEMVEMWS